MNPDQALRYTAIQLKIDLNLLKAFLRVESSGKHYGPDGRITIRFEPHIFKKYSRKWKSKDWKDCPHGSQDVEYASFEKAKELDEKAAYKSISMGAAQIMGFNCQRCGYETAEEMYNAFTASAVEGILAFGEFIRTDKKLHKACQSRDYHIMASLYNGKGYKKFKDSQGRTYADKILQYYQLYRNQK